MIDHAAKDRHEANGDSDHTSEARGAAPSEGPGPVCDLCGSPMIDRHCKLACPTCGYQRDCSDP